ncbi:MAG TPA: hypothetical protein VJ692_16550 [Nitrospiraceae bacterium]|nr:hypothetical protein [Nitrospiraceae bacterium]
MNPQNPSDDAIEDWLKTLGVASRGQWDTLVFLYRYHASLVSAEHIACLLGYAVNEVIGDLDALESVGLVERSRTSQGVRLYQFTRPTDPKRGDAFDHLMFVGESRAIRLLLARKWRPRGSVKNIGHHSLQKKWGGKRWLRVI